MKLAKVEVTGFKSFQKKTTFEFKNNLIGGKQYGSGTATTKKESEQLSAKQALEKLGYKDI